MENNQPPQLANNPLSDISQNSKPLSKKSCCNFTFKKIILFFGVLLLIFVTFQYYQAKTLKPISCGGDFSYNVKCPAGTYCPSSGIGPHGSYCTPYLFPVHIPTSNIQPKIETTQTPSPTPTQKIDETSSWKTYTNEKYGFSFKYPSGFNFEKQDNKLNIITVYFKHKNYNANQKNTFGKPDRESRQFFVELEKSNLSVEEYVVKTFDLKEFKIGVFKNFELGREPYTYPQTTHNSLVDEIKELNINGKKFIVVHIPGAANGDYYYFVKENGITASSSNGYFTSYIENFNQILSTFKFTDP
ncbi:MAG: hypothetical protein M1450_02040 [Patescibacteria group bacterium]|nr:hypothetical protein [Patescibacteria group bacterium]